MIRPSWISSLSLSLAFTVSGTAFAQNAPNDPPGAADPPPTTTDAIAKALDTSYRPMPGGAQVKFNLEDADLAELVNHVAGLTGRRFIYGPKVRNIKVTVVSPAPVSVNEAYEAFLSILNANGMTVIPHGRFLKIVDSGGILHEATELQDPGSPIPGTDRFITRLYRLKNASADEAAKLLNKFKSKEGDISTYEPSQLLIITDTGSNIQRMVRLIEEVDVGGVSGAEMYIEPVNYGSAGDMAKQINEIFELDGKGGGVITGLSRVLADEQTNSLVIVGSEESYMKMLELMQRIDSAPAAEGKIHVLPLQHAQAEELARVLTQMLSGGGVGGQRGGNRPAAAGGGQAGDAGGVFESGIRVTADPSTNSLVVTSSSRDYAQLRLVIEKLDQKRRQVFIEAVVMDLTVSDNMSVGFSYHAGAQPDFDGQQGLVLGGFNAQKTIVPGADSLQAFALGVRGPDLPNSANSIPGLPAGISIPAFGVTMNAMAQDRDNSILLTPHIIATDNTEASIDVGQNIPLQQNFAGSFTPGGISTGTASVTGVTPTGNFNSQRQDVGTKLKIKPHINESDQVRLEIQEEISEQGEVSGTLGAVSIIQRRANTTVVVDDRQTVVIGGLVREQEGETRQKVPILGDLPIVGFLFRQTTKQKAKTNLLLILTPYIIENQNDLRLIFQRKMQERQEFLDRHFIFTSRWIAPADFTRTNGLLEEIRQEFLRDDERTRLEEESAPRQLKTHEPTTPIRFERRREKKSGGGGAAAPGARTPAPRQGALSPAVEPVKSPILQPVYAQLEAR